MPTRADRNNNPGNLRPGRVMFQGQTGVDPDGFAVFGSPEDGVAAADQTLQGYGKKGINTPAAIAHRWSATDQDAYTSRIAQATGVGPNDTLDLNDPTVRQKMLHNGMFVQEGGSMGNNAADPDVDFVKGVLGIKPAPATPAATPAAAPADSDHDNFVRSSLGLPAPSGGTAPAKQTAFDKAAAAPGPGEDPAPGTTDPLLNLKAGMQHIVDAHRAMGETDANAALGDVKDYLIAQGYNPAQFTNLPVNVQTGQLNFGDHFKPEKIELTGLNNYGNSAAGAIQAVPSWLNSAAANADQAVPALGQLDGLVGMTPDKFRAQAGIQNQIEQASQGTYTGPGSTLGRLTGTALATAPAVMPALAALPELAGARVGGFLAGQGGRNLLTKGLSLAAGGGIGGGIGGTVSGQSPTQSALGGAVMGPLFGAAGYAGNKILGPAFDTVADAVGPTLARGVNALTNLTGLDVPQASYTPSVQAQAQRIIGQRIAQDTAGGAPAPAEIQAHAASLPDKPLTPMDYGSNTQALAGKVFRNGGAGRQIIDSTLTDRGGNAASRRVVSDVQNAISNDGPSYTTAQALDAEQKATAKPLYAKAFEGGSTAPLETQFQGELQASGAKAAQAAQAVNAAQNEVTQAAAEVSRGGDNVYSSSQALARQKAAQQALTQAQSDAAAAQAEHAANLSRLQQAQADGSANAPGAVWSPQIQRIIGNKFVRGGLQRGIDDQEAEAITNREPFNPNEYAITGKDADGNPIVSQVPNMKTLHAAKVGLDAQIGDETDVAGNVSSHGRVLIGLKNSLLGEMDRLNPSYATARAAYSGSAASKNALALGSKITTMPHAQFNDEFSQLSDADKALARQGAAEPIINQAMKPTANGMPPASLKNNDFVRRQLSPLFDKPADYDAFIGRMDAERQMAVTKNKVMGGSDSADRIANDNSDLDQVGHVINAVQSGAHAATGSPAGILNFANALQRLTGGGNNAISPALSNALAQRLSGPVGDDFASLYGNAANPRRFIVPPVLANGVNKLVNRSAPAR